MSDTATPRRLRAFLAGAAVLGLGGVGTLALWSDSEFARVVFNAVARFRVEAATSAAGPWDSHGSGKDAATLTFDFPAGGLVEEEPVNAEFWLRMDTEATGTVSVLAPTVERDDLAGRIDVSVSRGSCADPGAVLQQGLLENLADTQEANAFDLPGGVAGQPGQAQPVCISATLNGTSDLPAGQYSTGRVLWEFVVTEKEA